MEQWDLYTRDRIKTGRTMTRGEKVPEGLYHLVVHVCLFNARGEMLIQQRQPFKSGWSGRWDVSVGGSAVAGDSSQSAARRELREELGVDWDFDALRPALTLHFPDGFDDVYLVECDGLDPASLTLQPEEVRAARWASQEEILRMVGDGSFIPYHRAFIELLFYLRNHAGTHTRPDDTRPSSPEGSAV